VIRIHCYRGWLALASLGAALAFGAEQVSRSPVTGAGALPVEKKPSALLACPHPLPCLPPDPQALESAIRRGVQFLVERQNPDGSWGSAHRTKGLDIYAPAPGAHQAFRAGVTALCVAALIEAAPASKEVTAALDRGEAWLLENLPKLRRATADALYNNWGHAYGVHALADMLRRRPDDKARAERIREVLRQQLDMLTRYECVDGGWCYYDFEQGTQRPGGSSISFVSAAVLVSLKEAERAGVKIPERLVRRATASIRRQRKPDFSYCYGEYLKYVPMHPVNRPGGSLGRSQACNLALRLWGDQAVTDEVLRTWLDRLFARNLWLDMGRKRPIPHESWFYVAGYFFYYGHYYAARCIEELPAAERSPYQDHLGQVLLHLQEKDGSWWDFPLYDYHQQYGTAFALMSLHRCCREAK
jgi:hypothetical protein